MESHINTDNFAHKIGDLVHFGTPCISFTGIVVAYVLVSSRRGYYRLNTDTDKPYLVVGDKTVWEDEIFRNATQDTKPPR